MKQDETTGYTRLPESCACWSRGCGHRVGGHLNVCKRSELTSKRGPQIGDLVEVEGGCVHAAFYPLGSEL